MWKFNNSLLYDSEYVNRVKKCIEETVEEYKIQGAANSPESIRFSIDDQLFFETLNCKSEELQYHAYSTGKKRERIKHSPETNNKLKSKQMELQKIREYKMKGIKRVLELIGQQKARKTPNIF